MVVRRKMVKKVFTARTNACSVEQLDKAMNMLKRNYKGIVNVKLSSRLLGDSSYATLFIMEIKGEQDLVEFVHAEVTKYVMTGVTVMANSSGWSGRTNKYNKWVRTYNLKLSTEMKARLQDKSIKTIANEQEGRNLVAAARRTSNQ